MLGRGDRLDVRVDAVGQADPAAVGLALHDRRHLVQPRGLQPGLDEGGREIPPAAEPPEEVS